MIRALGLIEVIGYPPAIAAADAALKAANVQLSGIVKVDGGIMTVQLFGDVSAIRAAVDAGSSAAERIGTVRGAHVIPRVDHALIGTIVKAPRSFAPTYGQEAPSATAQLPTGIEILRHEEAKQEEPSTPPSQAIDHGSLNSPENSEGMSVQLESEGLDKEEVISLDDLDKKSNGELRNLIQALGITVSAKKLKVAKKEELIDILKNYKDKPSV